LHNYLLGYGDQDSKGQDGATDYRRAYAAGQKMMKRQSDSLGEDAPWARAAGDALVLGQSAKIVGGVGVLEALWKSAQARKDGAAPDIAETFRGYEDAAAAALQDDRRRQPLRTLLARSLVPAGRLMKTKVLKGKIDLARNQARQMSALPAKAEPEDRTKNHLYPAPPPGLSLASPPLMNDAEDWGGARYRLEGMRAAVSRASPAGSGQISTLPSPGARPAQPTPPRPPYPWS
jgi:hypothetical protein